MAKKKKIEGSLEKEKFLIELGIKFAKELTTKATPWELEFGKILITLGVEFYFQYPIVCEKNYLYILDYYLPEYGIVFELDGKAHYTKEKKEKDTERTKRLKKKDLKVIRIRNTIVKHLTPSSVKELLK